MKHATFQMNHCAALLRNRTFIKGKPPGWPECAICPKSCYFYKPCATKNGVLVAQQKVLFWKSKSCDFATFEPKGCYCCYFWIKCQNQAKNQCNFKVFKCVNLKILPCGAFVVFICNINTVVYIWTCLQLIGFGYVSYLKKKSWLLIWL